MIHIENIDDLISKFFSGEASPEEAMLLEDWKNQHPDNLLYYSNSEQVFFLLAGEKGTQEITTQSALEKIKRGVDKTTKVVPLKKNYFYAWVVAACIVMLMGIVVLFNMFFKKEKKQQLVYTTTQTSKQVKLGDGTEILISSNSTLVVDNDFGIKNRMLHLKGNANFTVVHQDKLPFVVDAGAVFIKDIGTKFSIRSSVDTDTVFVKVDEGVVLLFDSIGASLEIKAMQKAMYVRSIRKIISGESMKNENQRLSFVNASLEEVVSRLNVVYHTTIVLENNDLGNCRITTQFTQESLETVLAIITETLGLGYEKIPVGYLIKGEVCQPH